ncbi:MAG TPA: hypothetical protein VMV35_01545 [Halothiobacillus sp.]|nr:hypothetical protein [Halothiobacillus sp.]
MDGVKPLLDLAEQLLKSLDDAKNSGDDWLAQGYIQNLRETLRGIEQGGYDEKYIDQVEKIREAIKA